MSAAANDLNGNDLFAAMAALRAAASAPSTSGNTQTTTFLMPPVFASTTQSSVLKSLSLAATSSSLVALIGTRFGAAPLAASQTILPLMVTYLSSSAART